MVQERDSLLRTFEGIQNDSLRLDSMIVVAGQLGFGGNVPLGMWLAEEAGRIAHEVGQEEWEAISALTVGSIYHFVGSEDKALAKYLWALNFSDSVGYITGRGMAWNDIASVQSQEYHFAEALSSLRKARADFLEVKNARRAAGVMVNIASVSVIKQFDKAALAAGFCDEGNSTMNMPMERGVLYMNMANAYLEQKMPAKARESSDLSLKYAEIAGDIYVSGRAFIGGKPFQLEDATGAEDDVLYRDQCEGVGSAEPGVEGLQAARRLREGARQNGRGLYVAGKDICD
ncbi:MAG: hypothetical protein U0176_20375 [Bacteroidia bacterium]